MIDPEFRLAAEKMQLQLEPIAGADIAALLDSLGNADQTDIQRLKTMLHED